MVARRALLPRTPSHLAFSKKPPRVSGQGPGWWGPRSLEQIEFLSPADRCPTVVHPELAVNVFGVGTHGVQGHHEFAGNFWAVQAGSEQPKHFKLTFREWLDQTLFDGRSV